MLSESRKIASMKDNRYARKAFDDWKRYGGAGVEMMASVLVGAFGGYGLDSWLHTKPWLMLVGFVLGSAAGFLGLFRLLDQEKKKED
jgi:F0F1-type ATP synthase assembly protein I